MHDENSRSRSEDWMARKLREAARREQPQFSEALHQRIMQSVRPADAAGDASRFAAQRISGARMSGATVTSELTQPLVGPAAPLTKRSGDSRLRRFWSNVGRIAAATAAVLVVAVGVRSLIALVNQQNSRSLTSSITRPVAGAPPAIESPATQLPAISNVPVRIVATPPKRATVEPVAIDQDSPNDIDLAPSEIATDLTQELAGDLPQHISAAAAGYTLDGLGREAKATAHLLVDQLPFEMPGEDWGL
ncbi:MAG TPA: hypothetical protein VHX65_12460 [Pirellulales bacterium]|nr:hypothetical protein [Pirellulales bacterium]